MSSIGLEDVRNTRHCCHVVNLANRETAVSSSALLQSLWRNCSHLTYYAVDNKDSNFFINGKNVFDKKVYTNKDIRQVFNEKKRVIPKGNFYWNSILRHVNWRKAWLLPYKFCISNKAREIHLKILHKIYPTNMLLSKFMDIGK